jgi:hypothetical protein
MCVCQVCYNVFNTIVHLQFVTKHSTSRSVINSLNFKLNPCSLRVPVFWIVALCWCFPPLVRNIYPGMLSHPRRLGSSKCGNLKSHAVYTSIKVSLQLSNKWACDTMLCSVLVFTGTVSLISSQKILLAHTKLVYGSGLYCAAVSLHAVVG